MPIRSGLQSGEKHKNVKQGGAVVQGQKGKIKKIDSRRQGKKGTVVGTPRRWEGFFGRGKNKNGAIEKTPGVRGDHAFQKGPWGEG